MWYFLKVAGNSKKLVSDTLLKPNMDKYVSETSFFEFPVTFKKYHIELDARKSMN